MAKVQKLLNLKPEAGPFRTNKRTRKPQQKKNIKESNKRERIEILTLTPPNMGITPSKIDQIIAAHSINGKTGPINIIMTCSHMIWLGIKTLQIHEEVIKDAKIPTHKAEVFYNTSYQQRNQNFGYRQYSQAGYPSAPYHERRMDFPMRREEANVPLPDLLDFIKCLLRLGILQAS